MLLQPADGIVKLLLVRFDFFDLNIKGGTIVGILSKSL
jgi:hypothetical protein